MAEEQTKTEPSSHTADPEQMASDAEGVWSPDIEQSFQEALAIYPPCGRRKIILSDEGKMYGRNELIARYIKLRTGKTRSRKQVSSHIQVLARRKIPDRWDAQSKEKALQAMVSMSSANMVPANALHSRINLGPEASVKRETPSSSMSPQSYWAGSMNPQSGLPPQPIGYPYPTTVAAYYASAMPPHAQSSSKISHGSGMRASSSTLASAGNPSPPHHMSPSGHSISHSSPILGPGTTHPGHPSHSPSWQSRHQALPMPLRVIEFSAYIEQQQLDQPDSYRKHVFVNLGPHLNFEKPGIEAIDIRQIYDKFPENKGGLKELFEKGPSQLFFLVKFWADLNTNISDDASAFYGSSSTYESSENMTITCSTKVCSFGKQVVEKVETEYPRYENGRFVYRISRSPMCEYMINFIHKLKHLPEKFMMNSVLENFTILQVVSNRDTQETLLCLAYVFEVSTSEQGAQHHIYRLVKD